MQLPERRGISPIIATLLLIAIAVAAGIVVYVFVNGLAGNLTQSGGQQVSEQVSLDAYSYTAGTSLTMYVRNVGSATITIDSAAGLFFNGQVIADVGSGAGSCNMMAYSMAPGIECSLKFTATSVTGAASGTSNQVKVLTKDGGTFVFNVIAGRSG